MSTHDWHKRGDGFVSSQITVEYGGVKKKIKDKEYLVRVHSRRISKTRAVALIKQFLPEGTQYTVTFVTNKQRSECIAIPNLVDAPSFLFRFNTYEKLTRGVVLHEIAHVLHYLRNEVMSHDTNFTNILIDILERDKKNQQEEIAESTSRDSSL